jgi:hypothetical protein
MKIELATRSTDTLKITWPAYPADMEAEIVRRLNTVPGIEGKSPRYTAPAIQCERLMQLFPKASFDYSALQAADRIARAFLDSLNSTGVHLVIDGDKVRAIGDNVSPLIEQLVNDRSPALMSFVLLEMDRRQLVAQERQGVASGDAGLELIAKGIQNAQRREKEASQFRYDKRQRRNQLPVQGDLFK